MPEESGKLPGWPEGVTPEDSRIIIIFDGQTSTPKATDLHNVTPWMLWGIAEWLSMKARQMTIIAEKEELAARQRGSIQVPGAMKGLDPKE